MADITLSITDDLATVTLNRPDKKNAVTFDMLRRLSQIWDDLKKRPGLRAVILTGAGGDFCAGIDLNALQSMLGKLDDIKTDLLTPLPGSDANFVQHPCTAMAALPVPVIAVVDGICIGAGLQIALGADFRIASPSARFAIMESKWGIIPDMGITQFLPRLMPADQAMRLIMTAEIIDAPTAAQLGLVTQVTDTPMQVADALVEQLRWRSPDAVTHAKQMTHAMYPSDPTLLSQEAERQITLLGTDNQTQAVMAGMTKQKPVFKN